MSKLPLPIRKFGLSVSKHSPAILTGIGLAGMTTSLIFGIKATPKALILMDEAKKELDKDELEPVDILQATWKCYIPTAVMFTLSAGCIIFGQSVHAHRNAALAAACALSDTTLREYQAKVIETIGERKEEEVRAAVDKERIMRNPISKQEVICTGIGQTLCFDAMSGRYFYSDIDKLRKAANELNRQMIDEMYISLNDLYYEIGLSAIGIGDEIGWNIDKGLIDFAFTSQLSENDIPCLVMGYHIAPQYGFKRI